jgi:hypothetical protein
MAKVFLFGIPYFFLVGFVHLIFGNLGRLFYKQNFLARFYSILVSVIYIYIYSFWGAYLKATIVTYSNIYNKWVLIIICFIAILSWMKPIKIQLKKETAKLNSIASSSQLAFGMSQREYVQSLMVIAFSMITVLPVSFIIFLFTDTIHETLFFEVPQFLSRFFIEINVIR